MKAINFRFFFIFFFALSAVQSLSAFDFLESTGPHEFSIGPDVYHLKREREGGTHQDGWLGGVRFDYERLKDNGIYVAADVRFAAGSLNGESSRGATLESTVKEFEVEGDLGWTLGFCLGKPMMVTPYIGYGYFWSSNDFHSPSPFTAQFRDTYGYAAVGLVAAVEIYPCLTLGANFKARWMSDAKQKISGGPTGGDVVFKIGERWLYGIDLPISYHFEACGRCWLASVVPYWQQRDYGGTESVAGDFIETHYVLYGARLMLGISF